MSEACVEGLVTSRSTMATSASLLDAWVERVLKGRLADVWRAPIAAMFDSKELDESDIVTEATDREAARTVWSTVLKTAAEAIEKDKGAAPSAIATAKALATLMAPTSFPDVTREDPSVSSPSGTLGRGGDSAYEEFEIARTPAQKKGPSSRAPSPEELSDMASLG